MKGHYEAILKQAEENLEKLTANLVTDENSFDNGGFISYTDSMAHPGSAAGALITLVPLYFNRDSKYCGDEKLYNIITGALNYIKRVQRPDGTFDLLTTNFYSSPDTGFIILNLAHAYRIAEKYGCNGKHGSPDEKSSCNEKHDITYEKNSCNEKFDITGEKSCCNEKHDITDEKSCCNEKHDIAGEKSGCNEKHGIADEKGNCYDKHRSADEKSERIKLELYDIIKKSGYGMVRGGFHTPNHRWVIAAALMMAYNITGEKPFGEMAKRYLNEGIDCDEYGEYTEKSPGIYNAVNDNALVILSEEMNREDLLAHVKRNLDMMLTYIEPDWTLFTFNSARQDKGDGNTMQVFYPTAYYHLYLFMAYKLKNKQYAHVADYILKNSIKWSNSIPNALYLYMLKDELKEFESEMLPIPENYHVYYEKSGIVRVRKGDAGYTILKDSSNFLFLQKGNLKCCMKMCASFFAKAQFKAQEIIKTQNGYRLNFKTQGYYRMPFEEAPPAPDWHKMDHGKRQLVNILDLVFNIFIEEYENGLEVRFITEGCDRVPVKVELCFSPHCMIHGESFAVPGEPGRYIVVKSGFVQVRNETDIITVGPSFGNHTYAAGMRGSEPQSKSDYTIYFTDFTNMDRKIRIEFFK